MLRLSRWKVILVALATVFGLVFTLPNLLPASATAGLPGFLQQRLNLGLDLQGGSYLLLEVDLKALKAEQLNNTVEESRRVLGEAGVAFSGLGVQPDGTVRLRITAAGQLDTAQTKLADAAPQLQGAAGREYGVERAPDQTLVLRPAARYDQLSAARAVDQSIEVIRRRVDQLGTREPTIIRQGADRIVVEAPGESDPEKLRAIIGKTAKLSFQMVDDAAPPVAPTAPGSPPPLAPAGDVIMKSASGPELLTLKKRIVVSGEDLVSASQVFGQNNDPQVAFRFNGRGAQRFGQATSENIGKRFAIVLDNQWISAPSINTAITGGSGVIEGGNFTQESANELALLLRSGALPAPLTTQEQRTVSAELGADAVRTGAISLGIGAAAIIVFIVLSYGLFGVFAAAALIVNVLILIATLSTTQATLTLPGVAGLILTLAVAVDANVLIYERMRDEARAGRTPLLAADNGFRRALVSIFDANVTTLISAAIMFQFGTGPVRGFALTLSEGVLSSLFTAILITQVLIGWWFRSAKPRALPI